jgi:nitrous oxidase accessory protein NosD
MNAHSAVWKRLVRVLAGLMLVLAVINPVTRLTSIANAAGPYVVDTSTDGPDTNVGDTFCSDGVDGCSLRAAIQQATNDSIPTTITFSSDLSGTTLLLDNTYGTLLWVGDNITVTGEAKNIAISGANLGAGKSIFRIEGSNNHLQNLRVKLAPQDGVQIGDFAGVGTGNNNTLLGVRAYSNARAGIYVFGGSNGGGQNNTISSSLIGASTPAACGLGNDIGVFVDQGATGTTVTSNNIICNTLQGVKIMNANNVAVTVNVIGVSGSATLPNGGDGVYAYGTTGAYVQGNLISGNGSNGLVFDNSTQASAYDNRIGTDASVLVAVPNGGDGLVLMGGTNFTVIGSMLAGDRNIFSGNAGSGIRMDGSGTHDNAVVGNYIGTNFFGTAAVANGQNGVRVQNGAHNNTIGGFGSAAVRNLISGNSLDGVLLLNGATQNYIDGNFIGLAADGLTAIPNGLGGVAAINAPNNGIGSGHGSTNQYISGNAWQGVYVFSSDNTFIGQSNSIGVAADNVTRRGNGRQGVWILDSINSTVVAHAVVYNGQSGVALTGSSSANDKIAPAYIAYNGGLPIDLGDDGPTANDLGDGDGGPNTLLNYPIITSFAGSVITGTACVNCTVFIYVAYGNPAAAGGGGFQIGSTIANGAGLWTTGLCCGLTRWNVSLVACESPCGLASNTSEMSPRPTLFLPIVSR